MGSRPVFGLFAPNRHWRCSVYFARLRIDTETNVNRHGGHYAAFFSRTPLNFFALFLTAMNLPSVLSRFVHASLPITFVFSCVRFLTAPRRQLSPVGSLVAMILDLQLSVSARRGKG